ncbi:hypothetical protein [Roseateles amylovorans]|uniref:Bacteriocin n=1 Tax=Roseateles amylovorans TaxID=2978473 RepID=A0ABY6B1Z1_9BURK|nr:hypothetical protein [Roseateles amylovorans]UXH78729.1 hypothetical protein N4261_01955 [Roseateles amylovorans]
MNLANECSRKAQNEDCAADASQLRELTSQEVELVAGGPQVTNDTM